MKGGQGGGIRDVKGGLHAEISLVAAEPNFARYLSCARLNLRVVRLLLLQRWLSGRDVAASYDDLAPDYDHTWLTHLRPVTDVLLARIPVIPQGSILDLGCGTGYSTAHLAENHPSRSITGVDVSAGMLEQARARPGVGRVGLVTADMLEFLRDQPSGSAGLIFSAWAIGYSRPAALIRESARVLAPRGILAFVVNYADTLHPVFHAFRQCMARYPNELNRIVVPRFPQDWPTILADLQKHGLEATWREEGARPIMPNPSAPVLPWLLKTGVLAGFDAMLPLRKPGPVTEHFEQLLSANREPIAHHYVSVIARRP